MFIKRAYSTGKYPNPSQFRRSTGSSPRVDFEGNGQRHLGCRGQAPLFVSPPVFDGSFPDIGRCRPDLDVYIMVSRWLVEKVTLRIQAHRTTRVLRPLGYRVFELDREHHCWKPAENVSQLEGHASGYDMTWAYLCGSLTLSTPDMIMGVLANISTRNASDEAVILSSLPVNSNHVPHWTPPPPTFAVRVPFSSRNSGSSVHFVCW